MESSTLYIVLMVVIVAVALAWKLPPTQWKAYFSSDDGKGILKGVALAMLFGIILAVLTGCSSGSYMNSASVYTGLDHTMSQSPQCKTNKVDNNFTSNLGLRANVWQSDDELLKVHGKYTHHSCAFGPDRNSYDAPGIELEYKLWNKN